ncbi:MAG: protein kinase domain-containing protein, partial [bacterium]
REPRKSHRVHIKLLPSEDVASGEAARFSREAETLAGLAHPNVVALLAAPTDDGARLIVMEWIDGAPFDVWADQVWSTHATTEAIARIVQTVATIASAVAAAHRRGVMHRDLKPSNVLVTAHDEAKVLDFGLAKGFADAPLVTQTGGFAGTPGWASPEQVAARPDEIDARADVHALGLLLYRALTGRTAFDTNLPILPLFEAIRTEVPPAPSRLRGAIPRELDLITMQAIEKDPTQRYQSADALERDLERFVAEEPIDAHPPSTTYVVRKFVRRHKAVTALAAIAASAVVTGTIVSAYLAIDASEARNAAVARADEADRARDRAERMNGFFRDLLANLREREAAGDRAGAKEIIALAAESIERAGVPRESEADLRRTLGLAFHEIGDYPRAALQYARATELLTAPADAVHLAEVLLAEARSLQHSSRRSEAPDRAREALAVIDRIDALAPLRAEATSVLAATLVFAGQPAHALAVADDAIALARTSRDETPLAHAMSTRALALELVGRLPEATEQALEAAGLTRTIPH